MCCTSGIHIHVNVYILYSCHKVLIGDQLTCKVIRGAKKWRESDIGPIDRLQWALEVPGIHNAQVHKHSTCIHVYVNDTGGMSIILNRNPWKCCSVLMYILMLILMLTIVIVQVTSTSSGSA